MTIFSICVCVGGEGQGTHKSTQIHKHIIERKGGLMHQRLVTDVLSHAIECYITTIKIAKKRKPLLLEVVLSTIEKISGA